MKYQYGYCLPCGISPQGLPQPISQYNNHNVTFSTWLKHISVVQLPYISDVLFLLFEKKSVQKSHASSWHVSCRVVASAFSVHTSLFLLLSQVTSQQLKVQFLNKNPQRNKKAASEQPLYPTFSHTFKNPTSNLIIFVFLRFSWPVRH